MTEQERDRLDLWHAAQSDADLRALLEEVNTLRAENRDLRTDNAALRLRIDAALERGRQIRNHRPRDIRGMIANVRDALNRRS